MYVTYIFYEVYTLYYILHYTIIYIDLYRKKWRDELNGCTFNNLSLAVHVKRVQGANGKCRIQCFLTLTHTRDSQDMVASVATLNWRSIPLKHDE